MFQVRRAPQRRGTPRPTQSKPHLIRPVEDITEDEIQLVADNMTDKVYNRDTVSSRPNSDCSPFSLQYMGTIQYIERFVPISGEFVAKFSWNYKQNHCGNFDTLILEEKLKIIRSPPISPLLTPRKSCSTSV